jgi:hypothetical protein
MLFSEPCCWICKFIILAYYLKMFKKNIWDMSAAIDYCEQKVAMLERIIMHSAGTLGFFDNNKTCGQSALEHLCNIRAACNKQGFTTAVNLDTTLHH